MSEEFTRVKPSGLNLRQSLLLSRSNGLWEFQLGNGFSEAVPFGVTVRGDPRPYCRDKRHQGSTTTSRS